MKRRKGYLALTLLLMLSAAAAIASGAVLLTARSASAPVAYGNSLRAVYAAESGAVWALASLKNGDIENKTISFTSEGTETTVRISDCDGGKRHDRRDDFVGRRGQRFGDEAVCEIGFFGRGGQ